MDRATPYHRPHSTQVSGFAVIVGGDDRWIGNVFLGGDVDAAYGSDGVHHDHAHCGTVAYDGYPSSFEEYMHDVSQSDADHERYYGRKLPAYVRDNVYLAGALPFSKELRPTVLTGTAAADVIIDAGTAVLEATIPEGFGEVLLDRVGGRDLRHAHFPNAEFEEPDGSPLLVDRDLRGRVIEEGGNRPAGPLVDLGAGTARIALA